MSVTNKFGLIQFVVMPAGFFGILIPFLERLWMPFLLVAWIGGCMRFLFSLKCPSCGTRVYQFQYGPVFRGDLYKSWVILYRCGNCGNRLDDGTLD